LDNIFGVYVHGFFDAGDIARTLVQSLCAAKGIVYETPGVGTAADFTAYKEQQYDILADSLRDSIDMKKSIPFLRRDYSDNCNTARPRGRTA
jgi:adenosylcobyric acid synthase